MRLTKGDLLASLVHLSWHLHSGHQIKHYHQKDILFASDATIVSCGGIIEECGYGHTNDDLSFSKQGLGLSYTLLQLGVLDQNLVERNQEDDRLLSWVFFSCSQIPGPALNLAFPNLSVFLPVLQTPCASPESNAHFPDRICLCLSVFSSLQCHF